MPPAHSKERKCARETPVYGAGAKDGLAVVDDQWEYFVPKRGKRANDKLLVFHLTPAGDI